MDAVRAHIVDPPRPTLTAAPRPPRPSRVDPPARHIVVAVSFATLLALLGAGDASESLAPPPAGAQGIHRIHLPRLSNGDTLPGRALAPGALVVGRSDGHTLTVLDDGRVLVVGASDAVELWDPRDRRSRLVAPLPEARAGHVAVRLLDGRVLVAGGEGTDRPNGYDLEPLASALVFDPASASWQPVAPMAVARRAPVAALLPDGRVLVAGGESGLPHEPPSAEVFDPGEGVWRSYPAPPSSPIALDALPNGRVLALFAPIGVDVNAALLDPSTARWMELPRSSAQGRSRAHVVLADGDVLTVYLRTAERFDAALGRWEPAARPPATVSATGALLPDGTVLLLGDARSARAYRYDPRADRWSMAGYTEHAHLRPAVAALADGRVLVAGGNLDGAPGGDEERITELFDPSSNTWTASWPASERRSGHTATERP